MVDLKRTMLAKKPLLLRSWEVDMTNPHTSVHSCGMLPVHQRREEPGSLPAEANKQHRCAQSLMDLLLDGAGRSRLSDAVWELPICTPRVSGGPVRSRRGSVGSDKLHAMIRVILDWVAVSLRHQSCTHPKHNGGVARRFRESGVCVGHLPLCDASLHR